MRPAEYMRTHSGRLVFGPLARLKGNLRRQWVKWIAAAALGWQRLPPMGR